MIEQAYQTGEWLGLSVWCEDEAGPYSTQPYPGSSWQLLGQPACQPHEYLPNGTAKMLTLFHPDSGQVRVQGVTRSTNAILLTWLQTELTAILAELPTPLRRSAYVERLAWEVWQDGLSRRVTLPVQLPPLQLLLIMDNLIGHKNPVWLCWCFAHGILPLYTPLGASWLNMAESIQRILKRRALDGQYYPTPQGIIDALEAVATHWNTQPTPFVWAGKRKARRLRAAAKIHRLGASGAATYRSMRHFYTRRRAK